MKKNYTFGMMFLLLTFISINVNAQNNFFTNKSEASFQTANQKRVTIPQKFRTVELNLRDMQTFLNTVKSENFYSSREATPVIEIPMPDNTTAKFHIWERSVMEPGLEAKFPTIKTYLGQGITDPTAVVTMDMTEMGFHTMVISNVSGNYFIDPYDQTTLTNYISYFRRDLKPRFDFKEEGVILNLNNPNPVTVEKFPTSQCQGGVLRTYRLAVGCSNQYAKAATGKTSPTKAQTMAKIVTTVNRVTAVYELEASIHFNLVSNNDLVVFVTSSGDPFSSSNSQPNSLITASQTQITNLIGSSNFDIGHTFSTGGGGLAGLGVVCDDAQKARGITGSAAPTGDAYDIDYVAHEIGHQFGGNHTFNAATGSCSGNGASSANAEPGSGTTIMAYAGICDINNVGSVHQNPGASGNQGWSDPQFHAGSLAEVYAYSRNNGGNSCAAQTTNTNVAPTANAGLDYTIPYATPFMLTGSGNDANGTASLTYSWEQMDVGASFGDWNATQGTKTPLFRSFAPTVSPIRTFPQIADIISATTSIGERLPTLARNMNFRLTVRDNYAGSGGSCFDDMRVVVNKGTSTIPFAVTSQLSSSDIWYEGATQTVTWDKGVTDASPFNVANVAIDLSIDGGYTYPTVLLASTPNDGSQTITVPYGNQTNFARVRVRALNNIFFNISQADFTVAQNPVPVKWIAFTGAKDRNNSIKLNWSVNEIDNHYYTIERSLDGEHFSKIGEVAASTASGNNHSYSFTDARPFASKNFYRIKQVDKNGSYSYSKTISVTIDEATSSWVVYPNPTTDKVNLFCNANYNNMTINVYDAVGKVVYSQTREKALKGEIVTVSLSNLAKGIYSVKLQASNAETTTKKIIVQ